MRTTVARAIVRMAAWLVPAGLRARWREEWLGEIEGQRAEGKGQRRGRRGKGEGWKTLRAALGAPWDAFSARWTTTVPDDPSLEPQASSLETLLVRTLPRLLDLKLAVRAARATPLLSLTAVCALSVGIGLSTAAFTVVKAAFYSQLFTPDGASILELEDYDRAGGWELPITLEEFARRREAITSFSEVAAYRQRTSAITLAGREDVRQAAYVTPNIFRVLGVPPMAGRDLSEQDAMPSGGDAALIGETLARQRFQTADAAVGEIVRVDGQAYTIVGVIPASCRFPFDADAWVTLQSATASASAPAQAVKVVGRAHADVPTQTAEAELVAVASQVPPVRGEERSQRVVPFGALARGPEAHSVGWSIVGALVMLLLVSSANVANLLLARAAGRQRELTVRLALGAHRGRLIAGLVLEAAVLGASAAVLGFVCAGAALSAFKRVVDDLPVLGDAPAGWGGRGVRDWRRFSRHPLRERGSGAPCDARIAVGRASKKPIDDSVRPPQHGAHRRRNGDRDWTPDGRGASRPRTRWIRLSRLSASRRSPAHRAALLRRTRKI